MRAAITTCGRASAAPCSRAPTLYGIEVGLSVELSAETPVDLSVQIGSLRLANPFMAASGCFGYGVEYAGAVDLASIGAVVSKGLFLKPREGHPPERIVETPAGMLNAIGLQGIGVHRYIKEKLPELRELGATNVVNICGVTIDEYAEVARILSDAEGVHALEVNIS